MKAALVILISCLLSSATVASAETSPDAGLTREPVSIRASSLVAEQGLNRVVFSGDVVATQGDLVMYSDELLVLYSADRKTMDRAEATGSVRVVRGEQVATAEKAVYNSSAETIYLSGNPRVKQGESFLEGSEITIFLREQRSVVHGAEGGRVNAVFSPEGKTQ